MRGLLLIVGVALSVLGAYAMLDVLWLSNGGSDPPSSWEAFSLFAPAVATLGLLLVGAARLTGKWRDAVTLRACGIWLGVIGLLLLVGPSVVASFFGATSTGVFSLVVAIHSIGPGLCLLVAAVVLFVKSGEVS
jgi:uncharacterized membrane protein YjjB (DUF3815 family)